MGNYIAKQPTSPYDKSLIQQLQQRTLVDLTECIAVMTQDYPDCQCVNYSQFEDIFGLMVDDAEPFFLKLQNGGDINGTVDVYETLAAFAVFSKDKFEKKVTFIFRLFDFDHSETLEMPELVLTLQSAARGLCKFVNITPPTLAILEDLALNIFALIDHDRNKHISFDEFLFWIKHNAELQEFLLQYANTQTQENMKKRYDTICSVFTHLFIMSCGAPNAEYAEEDALTKILATEGKNYVKGSDLKFLIEVLRTTTDANAPKGKKTDKLISRKAYDSVMRAWSAFSSADHDNSNNLSTYELYGLLWVYEGQEPSETRVTNERYVMDKDQSGGISRYEWMSNLCQPEKNGKAAFRSNLKDLFEKYDVDNSGSLSVEELKALLKEAFRDYSKRATDSFMRTHLENMIDALTTEIFETLDTDGNKSITWNEFKDYMEVSLNKCEKLKEFLNMHF